MEKWFHRPGLRPELHWGTYVRPGLWALPLSCGILLGGCSKPWRFDPNLPPSQQVELLEGYGSESVDLGVYTPHAGELAAWIIEHTELTTEPLMEALQKTRRPSLVMQAAFCLRHMHVPKAAFIAAEILERDVSKELDGSARRELRELSCLTNAIPERP